MLVFNVHHISDGVCSSCVQVQPETILAFTLYQIFHQIVPKAILIFHSPSKHRRKTEKPLHDSSFIEGRKIRGGCVRDSDVTSTNRIISIWSDVLKFIHTFPLSRSSSVAFSFAASKRVAEKITKSGVHQICESYSIRLLDAPRQLSRWSATRVAVFKALRSIQSFFFTGEPTSQSWRKLPLQFATG